MQDGSLRVYPLLEKELSVNTLKKYWCLNVHDNDSGQIQCICSSFDDTFLITCGGDGNIFTFDILSLEGVPKERKAKIPSPRSGLEKEKAVEDIVDPDAYNIEEVKQKKESERIKKEAEEKKNKEREEIIALRHDFVSILQKNQELPKHMQLRKEEYEMDHRIFEELDREKAQRIQLVQNELSQEHKKELIGLRKLQKLCWDSLELTVVVHAFQSNHQVSTYRLLKEAEKYSQDKEQVGSKWKILRDKWRILKQAEETKETKITTETSQVHTEVQKPTACYIAIKREKIRGIVEKSDKMQAQVMKRKAHWDELYKSKPNDDHEDPKDAEEITEAQENRGYYKLKPASDYGLPEHKYVNTSRKMMQLKSLKRLIHRKKVNMNKEIMSLRDLKVSVFDEIECLVQELKSIQATLDESERLPLPLIPQLHPDEVLEKKFECNSDIFLNSNEEQAKAKLQGQLEGSASFRAFRHGFIPAPSVDEVEPMAQAAGAHRMSTEQQNVFEMEKAEPTEIELEILKREKIKSLYLQETLIKEINMLVISFDAEVCFWRHKKLKMDVQMKNADLRCITCSKELLILKKREKLEKLPQQRIHTLIREQEAIQVKLKSYLAKMEERKCEILKLQESKKALYASFKASLGEDNEFAHFLTKVLKKKNECVEKKEGNKADDDEEDGEESDLWTNGESSGSEDEDFDDSVCPDDCDEALFLNTIQLRQQRLDIEEAFAEEKKVAADLRREYNALAEEAKEVETSLNMTKRDLEILQWEKLQRLNELYVPVPLKIHQVQCLVDGKIPSDFFQALVFTSQSLKYLQESIADLQNEKIMHREAQEKYKQLLQEKKQMELESQRLEEKCNHLMIEKFGRLIDLGAVQGYSVNVPMEDMKVKTMQKEYERFLELRKWEERILELQQQLVKVREENSSKLLQLNKFCREKHQLETKLDSLPND
ncbi:CFA44 protein, partial [Grallaria varia]|nr:CFA44 protein [Grallaria varia]